MHAARLSAVLMIPLTRMGQRDGGMMPMVSQVLRWGQNREQNIVPSPRSSQGQGETPLQAGTISHGCRDWGEPKGPGEPEYPPRGREGFGGGGPQAET